jgi:N-acetyl-gamma-glutamyl-phosphate reductase
MLNNCDIAILCLPDEAAREAVALVENPHVRIIDASSAHRVTPGWTYGFPEIVPTSPNASGRQRALRNRLLPNGRDWSSAPAGQCRTVARRLPLSIHAVSSYSGGEGRR